DSRHCAWRAVARYRWWQMRRSLSDGGLMASVGNGCGNRFEGGVRAIIMRCADVRYRRQRP
ncbi:MAG: hypothetical protein ACN6O1_05540, partial [Comamonas sp.]|uniref:hypothetical protein n=1 Tax=Comamonas sp. TaxID=34028 RepID=UPI003D1272EB